MSCPARQRTYARVLLSLGSLLLAASVALLGLFPEIYEMKLKQEMSLVNGSTAYDLWKDLPVPIFQRVYFFNITNAEDFISYGVKPRVTEVGPYTYAVKWTKNVLGWHQNGTISYKDVIIFYFDPERSSGTENDVIVSLNCPLAAAAKVLKKHGSTGRKAGSNWLRLHNESIIITKTVAELGFAGYDDPVIKYSPYTMVESPFQDGKFGWLHNENNSGYGVFTVFTGQNDFSKFNLINQWRGQSSLNIWNGAECNMINGTVPGLGPPLKPNQTSFTFFAPLLCRSVTFALSGEEVVHDVLTRKFVGTKSSLGDSCFRTEENLPSGLQDISPCQFDVPIVASFPHFFLAELSFPQVIDGLHPDGDKHSPYYNVEPYTGVIIKASFKIQVNLLIERVEGIKQLMNVPEGVYPIFWGSTESVLPEDMCKVILAGIEMGKVSETAYYSVVGVIAFLSLVMVCVGGGLLLLGKDAKSPAVNSPESHLLLLQTCAEKMNANSGKSAHAESTCIRSSSNSPRNIHTSNGNSFAGGADKCSLPSIGSPDVI